MREISKSKKIKKEGYTILTSNKKSRYAVLKHISTGDVVIADILDFKVLYKLKSSEYKAMYVKPRSVIFNTPRTKYLKSKNDMAYVYFLKDFDGDRLMGVLVFEDNELNIFNSLEESRVKITNVNKAVLLIYYTLQLEDVELFSGYNLKLRYINMDGEFQELGIDILTKSYLKSLGGISIRELVSFGKSIFLASVERNAINIEASQIRNLNLLEIQSVSGIPVNTLEVICKISNLALIKHYYFLK